jgi:hypothetical protein
MAGDRCVPLALKGANAFFRLTVESPQGAFNLLKEAKTGAIAQDVYDVANC